MRLVERWQSAGHVRKVVVLLGVGLLLLHASSQVAVAFEGLALHFTWPLLLLTATGIAMATVWKRYIKEGQSLYVPWTTGVGATMVAVQVAILSARWAADWSLGKSLFAVAADSVLGAVLAVAVIAGTGCWKRWTEEITERVARDVDNERLDRFRRRGWSPHLFHVLDHLYRTRRDHVLRTQAPYDGKLVRDFELAARALWAYAGRDRPRDIVGPAFDPLPLFRERAAICGAHAQGSHAILVELLDESGLRELVAALGRGGASSEDHWMAQLIENSHQIPDLLAVCAAVERPLNSGATDLESQPRWLRLVAWQALAPAGVPQEARLDVLLRCGTPDPSDPDGPWPILEAEATTSWAKALLFAARRRLRGTIGGDVLGQNWRAMIALGIGHGASTGAQRRQDSAEDFGRGLYLDSLPISEDSGADAPSPDDSVFGWPHPYLWLSHGFQRACVASAILFATYGAAILLAVNPWLLPPKARWNIVDHISDTRWVGDYSKTTFSALAQTAGSLGGATSGGVSIIDKKSRAPHFLATHTAAIDITAHDRRFLALLADQSIVAIEAAPPYLALGATTWLPAPRQPIWPAPAWARGAPSPAAVLALDIEAGGNLLLAIRDRGVARYQRRADVWTREWLVGPLSAIPLDRAFFTKDGAWLTYASGGAGRVAFSRRADLSPVAARALSAETPITRLEGGDDWASAIAGDGSAYLFRREGGGDGAWMGPFFRHQKTERQLKSIDDIRVARVQDGVGWFGTPEGAFCYDPLDRNLEGCGGGNAVVAIEPVTSSANAPAPRALFATAAGLSMIERPKFNQPFRERMIDAGPVRDLSVSPDTTLAVFTRSWDDLVEVRTAAAPYFSGSVQVLRPHKDGGWKVPSDTLELVDLLRLGAETLFLTSSGAFLYDSELHTYTDASTLGGKTRAANTIVGRRFEPLHDRQGMLTLADKKPVVWETAPPGWRQLDPGGVTHPTRLAIAKERTFAVDSSGAIDQYDADKTAGRITIHAGRQAAAAQRSVSTRDFLGDLTGASGDSWRAAFLVGDKLVGYDSSTGGLDQVAIGNTLDEHTLVQVRLAATADDTVLRDRKGTLRDLNGTAIFGGETLRSSPSSVKALAVDPEGTVWLGDANGRVSRYDFARGSWVSASIGPASATVTELEAASVGLVARLSDHRVMVRGKYGWQSRPEWSAFADGSGDQAWAVIGHGVADVGTGRSRRPSFAGHVGMHDFVRRARYAWAIRNEQVVFIDPDGAVGIYDAQASSWDRHWPGDLANARGFARVDGGLLVLTSSAVVSLTERPKTTQLATFPPDAEVVAAADGKEIRLAVSSKGETVVHRFVPPATPLTAPAAKTATATTAWTVVSTRRGDGSMPVGFDAERVRFAHLLGEWIVAGDDRGTLAAYLPSRGYWRSLRLAPQQIERPTDIDAVAPTESGIEGWRLDGEALLVAVKDRQVWKIEIPRRQGSAGAPTVTLVREDGDSKPAWNRLAPAVSFDSPALAIRRVGERSRWFIHTKAGEEPLILTPQGFAQDRPGKLAFTTAGDLVTTGQDGTWTLVPDGKGNLWPRRTNEKWSVAPGPFGLQSSVELPVGPRKLVFATDAQGQLTERWTRDAEPVWGECGALALDCIEDVAVSDGDMLLATEAGLIVRPAGGSGVKAVYPALKHVTFRRTVGPRRLLLQPPDATLLEWRSDGAVRGGTPWIALDREPTIEVKGGNRAWVLAPNTTTAKRITVRDADGATLEWLKEGDGYRLQGDRATWIGRSDVGELTITTDAGRFGFSRKDGRSVSPPSNRQDDRPVDIDNAAIQVRYRHGRVSLTPTDGPNQPIFEDGRFYFDASTSLCGTRDALYVLAGERGIFVRDPTALGSLRRRIPLPPDVHATFDLTCENGEVELLPRGDGRRRWRLSQKDKDDPAWQSLPERKPEKLESAGAVEWWRMPDGRVQVRRRHGTDNLLRWWHRDRFVWDAALGAVALDAKHVLLATPGGIVFSAAQASGGFVDQRLYPAAKLERIVVTRDGGIPNGAAAWGERGRFRITPGPQGPEAAPADPDRTSIERAVAVLGPSPAGSADGELTIFQRWRAADPAPRGRDVAFESELTTIPKQRLLSDGQFFFDRAGAAVPAGGDWIVFAPAAGDQNAGLRALYRVGRDERRKSPRLRLMATDYDRSETAFDALLPHGGGFAGTTVVDGVRTAWTGGWTSGRFSCCEPAGSEVLDRFRTGSRATFNAPDLTLTVDGPSYRGGGKAQPVLEVKPPEFPLLVEATVGRSGLAFSFDVARSIAFDSTGKGLGVATAAGVVVVSAGESRLGLIDASSDFLVGPAPANVSVPLDRLQITRLRAHRGGFCARGEFGNRLLTTGSAGLAWSQTTAPCPSSEWTEVRAAHLGDGRIQVRSEIFAVSNDAFGIGRRRLEPAVEVLTEGGDRGAVWMATAHSGLFRIAP